MDQEQFLEMVKSRTARIAVGASTVRNSGSAGTVTAAQSHLRRVNLAPFGTADARAFSRELDNATEKLRIALPSGARHWGIARKVLNIFLRDCFYTTYLSKRF